LVSGAIVVLSLNGINGDFLRPRWVSKGWDTNDSIEDITKGQTQGVWSIKSARLDESEVPGSGSWNPLSSLATVLGSRFLPTVYGGGKTRK
jgi:hypothetical protein